MLLQLDEPFTEDALIPEYLAYLVGCRIPDRYLPQFEAEARALCGRFPDVPAVPLDAHALETYIEEGRQASLPERALRNRRVAAEAFADFLRRRSDEKPDVADAGDKRRHPRVPFLTEVCVADYGTFRCSDISAGGMYIENLTTAVRGTLVRARFKLRSTDADTITVEGRVSFVHPQFGAGVEFVSVSPGGVERIAELVASAAGTARAA